MSAGESKSGMYDITSTDSVEVTANVPANVAPTRGEIKSRVSAHSTARRNHDPNPYSIAVDATTIAPPLDDDDDDDDIVPMGQRHQRVRDGRTNERTPISCAGRISTKHILL